ncbi:hypothetical protein [Ornithinimicrobium avium]|uniref:Uncharacterized protein n=1 Tax=Ornithinimicrobium avium TaxID=2283195 RepID=A0A345NK90_9MICO|nr:hypothetical protein [Ornithinimicrobium avium]AXH95448.1 hypothetical protein DV701_04275 [Ornithinimicrobium avium]
MIEAGNIVQLTDLARRGSAEPTTYTVLPPWLRRDLDSWKQASHDIYRRDFTDADGDEVSVLCWLHEGRPALIYPFLDVPSGDLSPLQPIQEHIDGEIVWIEPKATARRVLPHGADPGTEAQVLVDGVARGLKSVPEHLRRTETQDGDVQPTRALDSWGEVMTFIRAHYKVAHEYTDDDTDPSGATGCRMNFDVGDGRSQVVFASRVDLAGEPWVRIWSPFARLHAVDLLAVLQRASRTVCGDVRLVDDVVTFNHTAPVRNLDTGALTDLVDLIVGTGDRLERELGTGDAF